ncbi:hypothetical protein AB0M95_01920 [Sphaerisporangium sp. NPDC051017]|uniref:hypothetical protein n=1 Tax=Sphaerisporangium sp. NPDC051017 TaxID=3154636 RepID=UPI003437DD02
MHLNVVPVPGLTESHSIVYGTGGTSMVVLVPDDEGPSPLDDETVSEIFRAGLRAGLELARTIARQTIAS